MGTMSLIKPILYKGIETGKYVSEDGTVFDKSLQPVKYYENGSGYYTIALCSGYTKAGKSTTIRAYVHRLVAEAFCDNVFSLPQVNHKNGNKKDNHWLNLEWVSAKDNIKHAEENNMNFKRKLVRPIRLTNAEKYLILQRNIEGFTNKSTADLLGRSRTTIDSFLRATKP